MLAPIPDAELIDGFGLRLLDEYAQEIAERARVEAVVTMSREEVEGKGKEKALEEETREMIELRRHRGREIMGRFMALARGVAAGTEIDAQFMQTLKAVQDMNLMGQIEGFAWTEFYRAFTQRRALGSAMSKASKAFALARGVNVCKAETQSRVECGLEEAEAEAEVAAEIAKMASQARADFEEAARAMIICLNEMRIILAASSGWSEYPVWRTKPDESA
ncbi:hypothetical protein GSI_11285 [Ganoderma sinense ZZ0214-1]|uniref:Uncharacterized protein n=1 Tax=Ganoderma sinense ZZ0214-1 TaxID=1077348 RepID=A0A2G8RYR9_9APHY|nr:hypothetical protein GSI_11285 [Ganoderma sinense ZZ0214-1]